MHLSKVIIVLATVSSSFAAALQTLRSESTPAKAIDDSIFERADVGKIEEKREEASTDADAAYGVYERGEESIDADAAYGVYEQ